MVSGEELKGNNSKFVEKRKNPSLLFIELGCLVENSLAKTLIRERMPGEEKEYTQGYRLSVFITLVGLTKVEL